MFLTIRAFIRSHSGIIWIAVLTGVAIVLFQIINLFVIYRYLQLDYYLVLVAICFGSFGWMLKDRPPAENSVPLVDPGNASTDQPAAASDLLATLTSKELVIMNLIAESKTNKEIAAALFVELSTVKTHVNNIYRKFSVSNRKEARLKFSAITKRSPFS